MKYFNFKQNSLLDRFLNKFQIPSLIIIIYLQYYNLNVLLL